ncbi:hypothetical protein NX04_08415 [Xanthomonas vasicola]|nr:hypothetical protein NX04_08415 [Xanthomonas vasicola]
MHVHWRITAGRARPAADAVRATLRGRNPVDVAGNDRLLDGDREWRRCGLLAVVVGRARGDAVVSCWRLCP